MLVTTMRNALYKHYKKAVLVALVVALTTIVPIDPAYVVGMIEAVLQADQVGQ